MPIECVSLQIVGVLLEKVADCPEDFLSDVAANIQRYKAGMFATHQTPILYVYYTCMSSSSLQDAFAEEVRECVSALTQGSSASQLRKRHADLQERVQGLWNMVHLFEKAIPLFEGQYEVVVLYIHIRIMK